MTPDEQKLKLALAKMLPDKIQWVTHENNKLDYAKWRNAGAIADIKETEWLHVCHLIEKSLNESPYLIFEQKLEKLVRDVFESEHHRDFTTTSATWQLRATALCKVKGITP